MAGWCSHVRYPLLEKFKTGWCGCQNSEGDQVFPSKFPAKPCLTVLGALGLH